MEVTVHLKDGGTTTVPTSNLNEFKRLNASMIDFIEEEQGTPVFSKPITAAVEDTEVIQAKKGMKKAELLAMAQEHSVPNVFEDDTNAELIAKINDHLNV